MIKIGDKIPAAEFLSFNAEGQMKLTSDDVFAGKKVVLFAVPGAFTPTCSMNHMPGFVDNEAAIKAKGVDTIACVSVNDVHVMKAWSKASGADGKIVMLADGTADFAKAVGLDAVMGAMGLRSKRYSMIVDKGVVTHLNVEEKSGVNVSGAETILEQL
ncbi:peroxiredoxin [Aestuariivirga litoralis]|uniref:peroxiredoxin n=1 Tax=Aestuariivirga litoralis TaxID=2650924 RepID=UPI0018C60E97|nr:peroxiredoxin [Aestuariivirga litoralis]MBG1233385.1 peroxiredoxin [Aestuariivirga litoralis]